MAVFQLNEVYLDETNILQLHETFPDRSLFICEQNEVLLWYLDRILVTLDVTEKSNITLTGKTA